MSYGTAYVDEWCDECVGAATELEGCAKESCRFHLSLPMMSDLWLDGFIDMCGVCSGGDAGITPCSKDCQDAWDGIALVDGSDPSCGGKDHFLPLSPCL